MNKKISIICFILLLFLMICGVSATDNENETLDSIEHEPYQDLCEIGVENFDESDSLQTAGDELLKASENEDLLNKANTSAQANTKTKVSLSVPNVKMYYKDGSKLKITLKDKSTKKGIKKANIKVIINRQTYNKVTDKNGMATLKIKLESGTYSVSTVFDGTNGYESKTVNSTVTVKSTIKCSDFAKYYKNRSTFPARFYDSTGKLLKNTAVKFKLDSKTTSVKTNSKGVARLTVDLKPANYTVTVKNTKTTEKIKRTITIKSTIETNDLTLDEGQTARFNVKILNSNGKASANKKVTLKVAGNTYSKKTNKSGIASLDIDLKEGTYTITTEYDGLACKNKITVNAPAKPVGFSHITQIPNYVNITHEYVFQSSGYVLKSGPDGIIMMPKNEIFTVKINEKEYSFSKNSISGVKTTLLGYKYHLIPFNGSEPQSDANKDNLKGDGIIISAKSKYTEIEYRSRTKNNTEVFGFYADKGGDNSEIFTYMEDDLIKAKIGIKTVSYDELGLKYSLSKFYGRSVYDFNYKSYTEYTYNNTDLIKFANTNQPVTLSYFGNSIAGYPSKEEITTKFIVNGTEEVEKNEVISYGLGEKYRKSIGFEVLQSYSIINEKITKEKLEYWVNLNSNYLNRFGVMNVYGMHLASLETTWLADRLADEYSNKFNVTWKRGNVLTILGGINLEDTYLNILNADMGMEVKGNETNVALFRLLNSMQLPNLEDYSLKEVSERYMTNTTNSQSDIFNAVAKNNFSIAQLGELIYIFAEDESGSAIVLNATSGVASVISSHSNETYKGASLATSGGCCCIGTTPKDIIKGIRNLLNSNGNMEELLNKTQPLSILAYYGIREALKHLTNGVGAASLGLFSTMTLVQTVGTTYRDKIVEPKDWYKLMDSVTFTRPGYLQGKKVYNIPNKNGGYDYVEVKINSDLTLDRNNAIYISNGQTKKLTNKETYKYFSDTKWSPISVPTKYWDKSWKG